MVLNVSVPSTANPSNVCLQNSLLFSALQMAPTVLTSDSECFLGRDCLTFKRF
jgi:hypothetical protein